MPNSPINEGKEEDIPLIAEEMSNNLTNIISDNLSPLHDATFINKVSGPNSNCDLNFEDSIL